MKKLLLTLTIASCTLLASAQIKNTGKKDAAIKPKPSAEIALPPTDTIMQLQPKDVLVRVVQLQNASFIMQHPDDVTPNQRRSITKVIDSLLKVDGTWYNKIHPAKQ